MYKLYVIWGKTDHSKKNYTFKTLAEKNAFIKGVNEMYGWNDVEFYDDLKSRNEDFIEMVN